jgi:potassium-transporting ATPase KdpC subunit
MTLLTRQLPAALRALLILTLVTGVLYPLTVLGAGQLVARGPADGSLVRRGDVVVGSTSLGQQVTGASWFHGRPSAVEYAGSKSGGSNLGPAEPDLEKALQDNATAVKASDPGAGASLPPDALTASGSGLDADISSAYAELQVARVAAARGVPDATVRDLVAAHTKGRLLGFLGEPRVNVTELNAALADTPTP